MYKLILLATLISSSALAGEKVDVDIAALFEGRGDWQLSSHSDIYRERGEFPEICEMVIEQKRRDRVSLRIKGITTHEKEVVISGKITVQEGSVAINSARYERRVKKDHVWLKPVVTSRAIIAIDHNGEAQWVMVESFKPSHQLNPFAVFRGSPNQTILCEPVLRKYYGEQLEK